VNVWLIISDLIIVFDLLYSFPFRNYGANMSRLHAPNLVKFEVYRRSHLLCGHFQEIDIAVFPLELNRRHVEKFRKCRLMYVGASGLEKP